MLHCTDVEPVVVHVQGYNTEFQKNFQVDQARLISLMVGSNIYNSKLDCFREYLSLISRQTYGVAPS